MALKRWQNLIHQRCPKCGSPLVNYKGTHYVCEKKAMFGAEVCDFSIFNETIDKIFRDKTHIMHHFLTDVEREIVERITAKDML